MGTFSQRLVNGTFTKASPLEKAAFGVTPDEDYMAPIRNAVAASLPAMGGHRQPAPLVPSRPAPPPPTQQSGANSPDAIRAELNRIGFMDNHWDPPELKQRRQQLMLQLTQSQLSNRT